MERNRRASFAAALALAALALANCGGSRTAASLPIPAETRGDDPTIAESPVEADAVMTCATIGIERAGIAQSLQRLDTSREAAVLRTRDAALAQLAALKRCTLASF